MPIPEIYNEMTRAEQTAFNAFFRGAKSRVQIAIRGDTGETIPPSFGKAECEWVPFYETWRDKFPSLGLTTFEESEPKLGLGMVAGSTITYATITVTDAGFDAYEGYMAR